MTLRAASVICAFALVALPGCAPKARHAVAPRSGVVDLDRLVLAHPGWDSIGQFDRAISEVRQGAAVQKPALGDLSLETLPAIDVSAPARPGLELSGERGRLERLGARQLFLLRQRREEERNLQLLRERRVWLAEADLRYQQRLQEIENRFGADYARIIAEQAQDKLNLTLQIDALHKTIEHWAFSIPPAPEMARARKELAEKGALYQASSAHLESAVSGARSRRAADIQAAAVSRDMFITQKRDDLAASLVSEDARQLEREARRLSVEREGLLGEIGAAETTSVPQVGSLAAWTMKESSLLGAPAPTAQAMRSGEQKLAAQRGRWREYLYQDARLAARDVALEKNWSIAFKKPGLGVTDMTAEVAAELRAGAWKSDIAPHALGSDVAAGSKRN